VAVHRVISGRSAGQIIEDRAFRPVITVTVLGQCFERSFHGDHLADLLLELLNVLEGEAFHFFARPVVLPKTEKSLDLFHRKTEVSRATNRFRGRGRR
jgi:hypothetical protein